MIRVFLAHSQVEFRQRLHSVLSGEQDIEVVGESGYGKETLKLIGALLPDVAILDDRLKSPNELKLTRIIRLSVPRVMLIVLGTHDSEEQIFEAIKAGAAAYFPGNASYDQLVDAIRRLSQGEYLINRILVDSPRVAARVLKQFQALSIALKPVESLVASLSSQEAQLLEHVALGEKNKQIAHALGISEQTVKYQVSSILRKLNANDRTQAVVAAIQRGFISLHQSDIVTQPRRTNSRKKALAGRRS